MESNALAHVFSFVIQFDFRKYDFMQVYPLLLYIYLLKLRITFKIKI